MFTNTVRFNIYFNEKEEYLSEILRTSDIFHDTETLVTTFSFEIITTFKIFKAQIWNQERNENISFIFFLYTRK